MNSERPKTPRETIVLCVGSLTSLVLAAAALVLVNDPSDAGRAEVARRTASASDAIQKAWSRLARDPAPIAESMGPPLAWHAGQTVSLGRRERLQIAPPTVTSAASALLAESERLELTGRGVGEALDAALEGLQKSPDEATRALLRLRAIQLGVLARRNVVVREQVRAAQSDVPANAFVDETPVLLACTLAAARGVPEAEACALLAPLARMAEADGLVLPGASARLVRQVDPATGKAQWDVEVDPVTAAWREMVDDVCPAAFTIAWKRMDDQSTLQAIARLGNGALPERPSDGTWHITRFAAEDHLAWRAAEGTRIEARFVSLEALESNLLRHVEFSGLLEDGFELALPGSARFNELAGARAETKATQVGEPTPLPGSELSFQLYHPAPARLMRSAEQRATGARIGMLVLAALSLLATFATFRALRRERRLAELKSTFVANVSHELRTPLASILLLSENLAAGRVTTPDAVQRYHGLIRREALRLRRLVEDVLDFSRLERGRRFEARVEVVDIGEWTRELGLELAAWAESHGATVEVVTGPLPRAAALDSEAVRRALFNLVDNGIRHGGSKHVKVTIDALDPGSLRLRVLDRGKGIPARERERVFEPFTRLEQGPGASAGTGLGLAIVREIVEAHAGRVVVRDPEEGTGTVFEITLPVERAESAERTA